MTKLPTTDEGLRLAAQEPIADSTPTPQTPTPATSEAFTTAEQLRTLPLMLTPEQAARLLNCSPKHCRDLAREGVIKGAKIGRVWRISRDALLTQFAIALG